MSTEFPDRGSFPGRAEADLCYVPVPADCRRGGPALGIGWSHKRNTIMIRRLHRGATGRWAKPHKERDLPKGSVPVPTDRKRQRRARKSTATLNYAATGRRMNWSCEGHSGAFRPFGVIRPLEVRACKLPLKVQ
jgi:hypothetical protein